jgi:opacity protein-like surface antigen
VKKVLASVAAVAGFLALTNAAMAADPVVESSAQAYFHLDGTYVFGEEGSGIENGFDPTEVFPGDGVWVSGYAGYTMSSGWDWRIGAGFADLSAGDTDGAGVDIYGVDDAKMFNLDADVGYVLDVNGATVRPFLGLRYLEWDQDQGFHPDLPLGCCFMNSEFSGFGPKLGFEASAPLSDMFSIVGGADVSVLFGEIDYTAGTSSPASTGADNRTAFTASGFAGLDISLTENMSLGARYHLMYLNGTSYDNQNTFGVPFGKASNLLHGPSASLTIGF